MTNAVEQSALEQGRAVLAHLNPGLEDALREKYANILPELGEALTEWAYGRVYARPGLDMRTRQLCTVAALTALGGQTAPQLRVNIRHSLAVGCSPREIVEAIWQMAVYGGMPAAINGLNAAIEVFEEEGV